MSICILPLSFLSVVSTASSIAFNATLASPFAVFAKKSRASASISALYAPSPFSLLFKAFSNIVLILSTVKCLSSKTILLETSALFTSK